MAKIISIFTDGTGNSASSVFKTNVWRLYQALDLTPLKPEQGRAGTRQQIAYYQDGVGTSTVKILAILGGAFGWGLKRNVIDAYIYLCETYRPGDKIFLFGFSRGGFTARVLLGLILSEGLLRHSSKTDLHRYAPDAYRRYRHSFNQTSVLAKLMRWVRDGLIWLMRVYLNQPTYQELRPRNKRVKIRFVGAWDTVSAYGLPIAELTRGIDRWIWPLSLPNNLLPKGVEIARHALALDDQREAFHPVIWDEIASINPSRILQVWFCGMHADVGGGYPQEGLSLIPLAWMMREAENAGLRFKDGAIEEVERWLTPSAPMHDSRRLFGAYYRYQPRRLGALIDPPENDTLAMRNAPFGSRGQLQEIHIHDSVLARISSRSDRYAPLSLPARFVIVGESSERIARQFRNPQVRLNGQDSIWNLVWWKRAVYFATLCTTIALLIYPFLTEAESACEDPQCLLIPFAATIANLLPGGFRYWASGISNDPIVLGILLPALIGFLVWERHLRRLIHDTMRDLWDRTLKTPPSPVGPIRQSRFWKYFKRARAILKGFLPWIEPPKFDLVLRATGKLRHDRFYQRGVHLVRWHVLPTIFGIATIITVAASIYSIVTLARYRIELSRGEQDGEFCPTSLGPPSLSGSLKIPDQFRTSSPCWTAHISVEKGKRYRITLEVIEPWIQNGNSYANPIGIDPWAGTWLQNFKNMVGRRSMRGRLFQPLLRIASPTRSEVQVLNVSHIAGRTFVGVFTAGLDGELFLFVNERMISMKGVTTKLYEDNRGSASVEIERL